MKKQFLITLTCLMLILSTMTTSVFAADSATVDNDTMTEDEAKTYLMTYCATEENSQGKTYTVQYLFPTEDDLNNVAAYISENGLDTFETTLQQEIDKKVKEETMNQKTVLRSVSPSSKYVTIHGNGNHNVSATAYGLASFDSLGAVEYSVTLGYRVKVASNAITNINNTSFNVSISSPGGSYGNLRFPTYYNSNYASVTANFDIYKTMEVPIGNGSLVIKTETDNEVFSLITTLS